MALSSLITTLTQHIYSILVDTARGFVYLGNSARAVRALAKTVNN
jgi:hypothetical protein